MNNYAIPASFSDSTVFSMPQREKSTRTWPAVISIPKTVAFQAYLMGEISNELQVIQPLQINIEQDEDNSYIVSDDVFLIYGDGNNRIAAMKEYIESLIEFYQIVKKSSVNNQFDKKLFDYLYTYIQPISVRGSNAVQTSTN